MGSRSSVDVIAALVVLAACGAPLDPATGDDGDGGGADSGATSDGPGPAVDADTAPGAARQQVVDYLRGHPGTRTVGGIPNAADDPKVTLYTDRITYQLVAVADLEPGTYIIGLELGQVGRVDGNNYRTPTIAKVPFQVGTPDHAGGLSGALPHNGLGCAQSSGASETAGGGGKVDEGNIAQIRPDCTYVIT